MRAAHKAANKHAVSKRVARSPKAAKEKAIIAIGNTQGISKVEAEVKVPDAKEPVFYTVKKGDNLWKISEHFYKTGTKHAVIFEANKPMLSHPDKIYPGQVLRIPGGKA